MKRIIVSVILLSLFCSTTIFAGIDSKGAAYQGGTTKDKDFPGMNEVYGQYFEKPYPNRATIVAQLMVVGARIEIVAYAHISKKKPRAVAARKVPRKVAGKASSRRK